MKYTINFEICRTKFRTTISADSEFEARKKILEYIKGSLVIGDVEKLDLKKDNNDDGFEKIKNILGFK